MDKPSIGVKRDKKEESPQQNVNAKQIAKENTRELVRAIREGNGDVFAAFYLGYADSIIRLLSRILGSKEDAEEVTQDAFMHIWETRATLSPQSTLVGFVAGVAKNMAFKHLRSRNVVAGRQKNLSFFQNDFADLADGELISRETELLILHTIRNMPAQRRKVFELSREEGLTYNEIAERLNLSYSTVRNHIIHALEDIRSRLGALVVIFFMSSL